MNEALPLLTLCLLWPLLGALVIACVRDGGRAKRLALAVAGVELLLTLGVVFGFDPSDGGYQWQEHHLWVPSLNAYYAVGVDGISLLFLPMTALLTLMALLAGWNAAARLHRFQLALVLILESATIGVFVALDMALFFLFWELTLPPIFFLAGLWGIGAERRQAALKYTLYMLFGGVPLLFAIATLALNHAHYTGGDVPGGLAFSLPVLLNTPMDAATQELVFFLLMLGFAVKAPLVPFHTWLPTMAMEGPAFLTALLVGLKLGLYGILRFALPLAPQAALEHRWLVAIVGAVTLVYAALIALQQTNLRRLLAYSSISHVGLVLMGLATFNYQGQQGALLQLLNFTLVAGSLMLMAGMLQQRLGSCELVHLGGLAKPAPRLACLFFLFTLASLGVPGANGFPAELLVLIGTLQAYPALAMVALFGAVLSAAYMLGFVRKALFGPTNATARNCPDLTRRELLLLLVPAVLVLLVGLSPKSVLVWPESSLLMRQEAVAEAEAVRAVSGLAPARAATADAADSI
ncbi:NuoM family protein [Methylomonas koyamae]|uniref:complex I subunit 4 family protein n=1 Tax=Methylomonas koyamae TaxID=702114 RepID=UPI001129DE95|nr:NADH-quinone oxidoreductase subunit M [Methylomonas koyamae]TPQ27345.1 oxidoreductase [Methylomonas koyamae]